MLYLHPLAQSYGALRLGNKNNQTKKFVVANCLKVTPVSNGFQLC